jgi:hypothetical protein
MKIPGLHQVIATKRFAAGEAARECRNPSTDPRRAYEVGVNAEMLAKEAEKLSEQVQGNDQTIEGIEHMIHCLLTSPHKSAYRTLAMRELEQASMWLRRENGEPEPERNFQSLPSPVPVNGHGGQDAHAP